MYLNQNRSVCACGKIHQCALEKVITGKGAILELPREIRRFGSRRVFMLADANTYAAAGCRAEELLIREGIPYSKFIFEESPEPDEAAVGAVVMHFDPACDLILAVGSGVIGDVSKILAHITGAEYVIVATAPSMDGYASATSSMTRNGLKVSLPSKCARVIIGDTDVLKDAPMEMLVSGLGDMLAKYISIAEWRLSHLITGEYYCETIAELIRSSLKKCVDNADGLIHRDETAVEAVFSGLVTAGAAMSYAGVSRPASGIEHYFSHVWDMRGIEFGAGTSTHGIQCAVATLITTRLYERMLDVVPDKEKGRAYASRFDVEDWSAQLTQFLGKGAQDMIVLEKKEKKYSVAKQEARLCTILETWDELMDVIRTEIPTSAAIEALLEKIGCPTTPEAWGLSKDVIPMTFKATKDIRDKYILSRLAFDLGILDELAVGSREKNCHKRKCIRDGGLVHATN